MTHEGLNCRDNADGSTHYTYWNGDYNVRYSWDEDESGYRTNRHMTDQDDNDHCQFEDCYDYEDNMF